MRALLDNIPDIVWLKDAESRFIAVNEPFGRTCGAKPDELVGKSDPDILAERAGRGLSSRRSGSDALGQDKASGGASEGCSREPEVDRNDQDPDPK